MRPIGFGYGLTVLALIALLLQAVVPHHHHEQALLLFTQSCPTAADDCHPPHDADDDCDQPHTEDTQCGALDHVLAIGGKQQGMRGTVDMDLAPLLPVLLALHFGVPAGDVQPTAYPYAPPRYVDACSHAHALRGPPRAA